MICMAWHGAWCMVQCSAGPGMVVFSSRTRFFYRASLNPGHGVKMTKSHLKKGSIFLVNYMPLLCETFPFCQENLLTMEWQISMSSKMRECLTRLKTPNFGIRFSIIGNKVYIHVFKQVCLKISPLQYILIDT